MGFQSWRLADVSTLPDDDIVEFYRERLGRDGVTTLRLLSTNDTDGHTANIVHVLWSEHTGASIVQAKRLPHTPSTRRFGRLRGLLQMAFTEALGSLNHLESAQTAQGRRVTDGEREGRWEEADAYWEQRRPVEWVVVVEVVRPRVYRLVEYHRPSDSASSSDELGPTPDDYDPYAVLGLEEGASMREVRSAYRRLAMQLHPDKTGGRHHLMLRFQHVSLAYAAIDASAESSSHRPPQPVNISASGGIVPTSSIQAERQSGSSHATTSEALRLENLQLFVKSLTSRTSHYTPSFPSCHTSPSTDLT